MVAVRRAQIYRAFSQCWGLGECRLVVLGESIVHPAVAHACAPVRSPPTLVNISLHSWCWWVATNCSFHARLLLPKCPPVGALLMRVDFGTKACKFPLPVMNMPVCVLGSVRVLAHALTSTGICIYGCVIIRILFCFSYHFTYLPPWGQSCERSSTSMGTVHYGYWYTI